MKNQPPAPLGGIPALVVSGFLGAGKTTLVQHLLKEAQETGLRLAVVSNEFGELGIDQALLESQGAKNYVELEGGCVCCKLSDELVNTLQQLWEDVRPDRMVVETSGVALPFDTLLNFWREPVSQWVGDCIAVVVVNAEQLAEGRDLDGTFEQQVSSADLLVLNKMDLVASDVRDQLEDRLGDIAPGTPIIHTTNAVMETDVLFPPNPGGISSRACRQPEDSPHNHEAFESEEILIETGVDSQALIEQIRSYNALRSKGFVQTSQGVRLLQGIGPRVDLMESSINPPPALIGRIVVIRRSSGVR